MTPARWQSPDPWRGFRLMTAPTWDPCVGFRFRNDDGSETSATWMAAENVNISVGVDTHFRLRMVVQMTNAGDTTGVTYRIQRSLNGGTWANILGGDTSPVKLCGQPGANCSGNLTNKEPTTRQLASGTGSFVAGQVLTSDNLSDTITMTGGSHTEIEISAIAQSTAGIKDGDQIAFRLLVSGAVHAATYTPTITISVPKPAVPPTLLSPADGAVHDGGLFEWQFNTENVGDPFTTAGQEAFRFRRRNYGTATPPVLSINNSQAPVLGLRGSDVALFDGDSKLLLISSDSSDVLGWSLPDWTPLTGLPTLAGTGRKMEVSPDGSQVAIGHLNGDRLTVMNLSDFSIVSGTPSTNDAADVSWSSDGSLLAVAGNETSAVQVFNTSDWSPVSGTPVVPYVGRGIDLSNDGNWLALGTRVMSTADVNQTLWVFGTSDWLSIGDPFDFRRPVEAVGFSPNTSQLAFTYGPLGLESLVGRTGVFSVGGSWSGNVVDVKLYTELDQFWGISGLRGYRVRWSSDSAWLAVAHTQVGPDICLLVFVSEPTISGQWDYFVNLDTSGGASCIWRSDDERLFVGMRVPSSPLAHPTLLEMRGGEESHWDGAAWVPDPRLSESPPTFVESGDEFINFPPGAWE